MSYWKWRADPNWRPLSPVPERAVVQALTAHDGSWHLMTFTLRAINTDDDAGDYLHRTVREWMGSAMIAGFEGREPTPKCPHPDAYQQAQRWIGMQLLRDVGPRGLSEIDWTALGAELTALAGVRIIDRRTPNAC